MHRRKKDRSDCCGALPSAAPLANPYVPFQNPNPPRYEAEKGLVRGTMYPGLDLPFRGMVNNQEKSRTHLTQLQALAFAVQDLALYLDTHRGDREALEAYRAYQQMYARCREEYQKMHGPMNHMTVMDSECYEWLDDPWPWEYAKNREV